MHLNRGSFKITHVQRGIKLDKVLVILVNFLYSGALFGLVSYHDPCSMVGVFFQCWVATQVGTFCSPGGVVFVVCVCLFFGR